MNLRPNGSYGSLKYDDLIGLEFIPHIYIYIIYAQINQIRSVKVSIGSIIIRFVVIVVIVIIISILMIIPMIHAHMSDTSTVNIIIYERLLSL